MATTKVTGNLINDLPSDVVATADLADGILSADATGRAKMANGFLSADAAGRAKMADGFVDYTKVAAGAVVQAVNVQTGAVATGTTTIPLDDTIPQNTEGDQYMSLAITPKSATNKLLIQVIAHLANSAAGYNMIGALFQDSNANALAAAKTSVDTASQMAPIVINHYVTAGTASETTFKFRAGSSAAGTTTFNGAVGTRQFGGVMASSITITEIKA